MCVILVPGLNSEFVKLKISEMEAGEVALPAKGERELLVL